MDQLELDKLVTLEVELIDTRGRVLEYRSQLDFNSVIFTKFDEAPICSEIRVASLPSFRGSVSAGMAEDPGRKHPKFICRRPASTVAVRRRTLDATTEKADFTPIPFTDKNHEYPVTAVIGILIYKLLVEKYLSSNPQKMKTLQPFFAIYRQSKNAHTFRNLFWALVMLTGTIFQANSQATPTYIGYLERGDQLLTQDQYAQAAAAYKQAQALNDTPEIQERLRVGFQLCLIAAGNLFQNQMENFSANPSFDEALKHYLYTREFQWSEAASTKINDIQQYMGFIQSSKNYLAQNQFDYASYYANEAYKKIPTLEALNLKNSAAMGMKVVFEVFFNEQVLSNRYDLSRVRVELVDLKSNKTIESRQYVPRLRFEVPKGVYTVILYNASIKSPPTSGEYEREIQIVRKFAIVNEYNAPMGIACEEPYNSMVVNFLAEIR